jgi:hypothetical protein
MTLAAANRTWIVVLAFSAACGAKASPAPFQISLRVEADPGRPLPNAQIARANKTIGVTNAEGRATVAIEGADGQITDVVVTCPEGHQSPARPVSIRLVRFPDRRIPEYTVPCPPVMRRVVVAVRAENGPNLPVLYQGKPVTRTDASGAASFALEVPPGSQVAVSLDTSERKDLRPPSPPRVFVVTSHDDIFLFDQKFEVDKRRGGPNRLN